MKTHLIYTGADLTEKKINYIHSLLQSTFLSHSHSAYKSP